MSNELTCRNYNDRLYDLCRGRLNSRNGISVIRDSYVIRLLWSFINVILTDKSGNRDIVGSRGLNRLDYNLFCNLCDLYNLSSRLCFGCLGSDFLDGNFRNRDAAQLNRLNSRGVVKVGNGLTYLLCDIIAGKCRNLNVINLCRLKSLVNYRLCRCGKHNRIKVVNDDFSFDSIFDNLLVKLCGKLNRNILVYNYRINGRSIEDCLVIYETSPNGYFRRSQVVYNELALFSYGCCLNLNGCRCYGSYRLNGYFGLIILGILEYAVSDSKNLVYSLVDLFSYDAFNDLFIVVRYLILFRLGLKGLEIFSDELCLKNLGSNRINLIHSLNSLGSFLDGLNLCGFLVCSFLCLVCALFDLGSILFGYQLFKFLADNGRNLCRGDSFNCCLIGNNYGLIKLDLLLGNLGYDHVVELSRLDNLSDRLLRNVRYYDILEGDRIKIFVHDYALTGLLLGNIRNEYVINLYGFNGLLSRLLLGLLGHLGNCGDYDIPYACRADRLVSGLAVGLIKRLGDLGNCGNFGNFGYIIALLICRCRLNVYDSGLNRLDTFGIRLLRNILGRLNFSLDCRIV